LAVAYARTSPTRIALGREDANGAHPRLSRLPRQSTKQRFRKANEGTASVVSETVCRRRDGTGGGLMKNPMPNAGSMWAAFVNVDDLKAATVKAKSLGGPSRRNRSR
jgi:hypothetical protein